MKIILILLCNLLIGVVQGQERPNRTALLIGVSDYTDSPLLESEDLKGIQKDLEAMRKALVAKGFEVVVIANKDKSTLQGAIKQFCDSDFLKTRKGVGLVYFSGHGYEVGGELCLIPAKANLREFESPKATAENIYEKSLTLSYITKQLQNAPTSSNIIYLDCCRYIKQGSGPHTIHKAENTFIGYSTDPGTGSQTTKNGSVFTQILANELINSTADVSISELQTIIRKKVRGKNASQSPDQKNRLLNNFYFNRSQPLKGGGVIDHDAMKQKVQAHLPYSTSSKIYQTKIGDKNGYASMQIFNDGAVYGIVINPVSQQVFYIYGDNSNNGRIKASIWKNGNLLGAADFLKRTSGKSITWQAESKELGTIKLTRKTGRKSSSGHSEYTGKLQNADLQASLNWQKDLIVVGEFRLNQSETVSAVKGDNINKGLLFLEEFVQGKCKSCILLNGAPHEDTGRYVWAGVRYLNNGTTEKVSLSKVN